MYVSLKQAQIKHFFLKMLLSDIQFWNSKPNQNKKTDTNQKNCKNWRWLTLIFTKKGQGAKASIALVAAILTDEILHKCKFALNMFKLDISFYKRHCQIFNFEIQNQNKTKKNWHEPKEIKMFNFNFYKKGQRAKASIVVVEPF
jgi:hypothetical protein